MRRGKTTRSSVSRAFASVLLLLTSVSHPAAAQGPQDENPSGGDAVRATDHSAHEAISRSASGGDELRRLTAGWSGSAT